MFKIFCFIVALLPLGGIAKSTFSGRSLGRIDPKYSGNSSIFSKQIMGGDTGITSKLKNFAKQHLIEKAYLHFDKPYYAAGDTMYFKAYLTMGEKHLPSTISGVLYADLINTNNNIDQSIKLQVINGVAWGDFALADSLPKGNYRVRAYTRWMRNDGDGAYFYQTIPVGSVTNKYIAVKRSENTTTANNKADIQFFPEGGELVVGIKSKVAFKAIAANGLGIDVKGVIIDNENKQVTDFKSEHLGMGYFYFTPQQGKTYLAKLTYTDGTQNTVNLPNVQEKGITLTINNDSLSRTSIKIEANDAYYQENKNKKYTLLVYSGGVATTVNCRLDSPVIQLDVLKRRLQTGIARVTLFSQVNEPLSERLFFVQNYNQLSISVNTEKAGYTPREKVTVNLNVKDRADSSAKGHFSVSVTDETKVPVDENSENTILTNLLLTSDLEGYVEQPNYYFIDINDKTEADLDLVMLTHGYRRFQWKQLLANVNPLVMYQPESNLEISGIAENLFGKPLKNASVSLIAMPGGQFLSQVSDAEGRFRFSNLVFTDTAKFVLQATNAKGKKNTKLIFDGETPGPTIVIIKNKNFDQVTPAYMKNNKMQLDEWEKYHNVKGNVLKEVVINDKKIKHYPSNGNLVSPEYADQLITSEDLEKAGWVFLKEMIQQKFYGRASHAGLIFIDGQEMPGNFDIDLINSSDVETIGAVYGASASIYGMRAAGGVWLITTKRGKDFNPKSIASIGILPISPKGYYKAREFYSPKYAYTSLSNNRPDLRSTILWKPEIPTDENGNASFEYYNADSAGSYRIVIEGIDAKGNIGRQVYRYRVK